MRRVLCLLTLCVLAVPATSFASTIFFNDFNAPSGIDYTGSCCTDASQQTVNSLFGSAFQQTFTVETLAVEGPNHQYHDPSGIGGAYTLGMLTIANDDLLSLTFNTTGLPFINFAWDIAAVGINQPGDTFVNGPSKYTVSLYNTPGGVFDINALAINPAAYALLDAQNVTGLAPNADIFTFDWFHSVVSLNTAGAPNVTLVINQTAGGYGAFDNMNIETAETPSAVPEPASLCLLASGLAVAARRLKKARA